MITDYEHLFNEGFEEKVRKIASVNFSNLPKFVTYSEKFRFNLPEIRKVSWSTGFSKLTIQWTSNFFFAKIEFFCKITKFRIPKDKFELHDLMQEGKAVVFHARYYKGTLRASLLNNFSSTLVLKIQAPTKFPTLKNGWTKPPWIVWGFSRETSSIIERPGNRNSCPCRISRFMMKLSRSKSETTPFWYDFKSVKINFHRKKTDIWHFHFVLKDRKADPHQENQYFEIMSQNIDSLSF